MENVKLTVTNELGQEVATIANKQYAPGSYEIKWDASNQGSGVYFYKISTPSYSETKRMVLVK
jgi:flagellar hook assembly protein FlgD